MRRWPIPLVLSAGCLGCTSVNPSGPLVGGLPATQWRVTAIDGRPTPMPPANYSVRFEQTRIGAHFGCNIIGGNYRASGSTIVTDAVIMTEMACGEPAATFEARGSAILMQPMQVAGDGHRMILSNGAGSIELVKLELGSRF